MSLRTSCVFLTATFAATVGASRVAPATAGDSGTTSQWQLRATRILERHRDRHEFPGAVLSLRESSGSTFTVTAGVADVTEAGTPPDPSTPWIIGSATKTFVAVVVLQLAQEGKLDLDSPVEPFFPDLPAASRITTRQLLQHTSGVNEYTGSQTVQSDARREWSASELIAVAVAMGPVAEPGTGYHYANTNYLLLGEIIERVTSRRWYVEVRSRIIESLGLDHTGYSREPSELRIGPGYVTEHGKFVEATTRWHPSIGGAAGGMYSTTADLLAFTRALFEGNLLDARRAAEMQTFVPGEDYGYIGHSYGLGLERYTIRNMTVLGHLGVGSAHSSFIGYDPIGRTAVAVQINSDSKGPAAFIGCEMLAEVAGRDISPPSMPSASFSFTVLGYQTLKRAGTGERIAELRVATQQASVSYPIVANEGRTRLELSAAYVRLQFDYHDLTFPLQSVHAVSATAFLRQKLTDTWGLILVTSPAYADDFEGPATLDALTLTLVAAGTYRFNDDLEIGFGAAMANVFGEPLPMPVAAVDWTINDKLWLRSILPVTTELSWLPTRALGLRASVEVSGSNYHGAESIYHVNDPQLNYSAVDAGLGARWFVLPFVDVTIYGGYTLWRRFEFSEGRDPVPGGKYELDNAPVLRIELGVGR